MLWWGAGVWWHCVASLSSRFLVSFFHFCLPQLYSSPHLPYSIIFFSLSYSSDLSSHLCLSTSFLQLESELILGCPSRCISVTLWLHVWTRLCCLPGSVTFSVIWKQLRTDFVGRDERQAKNWPCVKCLYCFNTIHLTSLHILETVTCYSCGSLQCTFEPLVYLKA